MLHTYCSLDLEASRGDLSSGSFEGRYLRKPSEEQMPSRDNLRSIFEYLTKRATVYRILQCCGALT